MRLKLKDYPEVVNQLSAGGFDSEQTDALVVFVGRLYSGEHEYLEKIQQEMREGFERSHQESRRVEAKLEKKIDDASERSDRKIDDTGARLDGKIERNWRTTVGVLASIVVAIVGGLVALGLRLLG